MLYALFLYQRTSGLMLWSHEMNSEMNEIQVELLSSFFSAIQSFVVEIVKKGDRGLDNIDLGTRMVKVTQIEKMDIELVSIADSQNKAIMKKIHEKIVAVLWTHKELFSKMDHWNGDVTIFSQIDQDVDLLLKSYPELSGKKIQIEQQTELLKSLWGEGVQLTEAQKAQFEKEQKEIQEQLKKVQTHMERADLLTKLLSYAEKLKDTAAFQQIQKDQQKLFNDFNDTLMRAQYFLKKAKECITSAVSSSGLKKLTELNYNDIYLNMYSFSTKLHLLGNITKADDFKVDAMKLIDSSTSSQEISGIIEKILHIRDDLTDLYTPIMKSKKKSSKKA